MRDQNQEPEQSGRDNGDGRNIKRRYDHGMMQVHFERGRRSPDDRGHAHVMSDWDRGPISRALALLRHPSPVASWRNWKLR